MNYRHAFHAGNFADCFKHAVLARLVVYLQRKDGAARLYDTHAGPGLFRLDSAEAVRTGEWREGIGRVLEAALPAEAAALLAPWLDAVRTHTPGAYPGSPALLRALARPQDRLSMTEMRPDDADALAALFAGDYQVRVNRLDGWLVPGAHVPPKERRGLVLIDPPFEQPGEFDRLIRALHEIDHRWPAGMVALWYPLKDRRAGAAFLDTLRTGGLSDLVTVEAWVRGPVDGTMHGSGLAIRNPPFTLERELRAMMPPLAAALAQGQGAGWRWLRLTDEQGRGA